MQSLVQNFIVTGGTGLREETFRTLGEGAPI